MTIPTIDKTIQKALIVQIIPFYVNTYTLRILVNCIVRVYIKGTTRIISNRHKCIKMFSRLAISIGDHDTFSCSHVMPNECLLCGTAVN